MSFRKNPDGKPTSDKKNGSQKTQLVGIKSFIILGLAMMFVLVVIWRAYTGSTPTSPELEAPIESERAIESEAPIESEAATELPISTKSPTPAEPPTLTIDDIKSDGVLIVAVAKNFPPFSYEDEHGRRVGFDVDIARLFAKRWLGDENAVEFKAVDSDQRIPILIDGDAHLTIAAMTATSERCAQVACSQVYFEDGARLLVDPSRGISNVCDLESQDVAVAPYTTGQFNIEEEAPKWCDYSVPPVVKEYAEPEDAFDALKNGIVAAYTRDGIGLEELVKQLQEQEPDSRLRVVGDPFSSEPYTIAVAKENQEVLELINFTLQEMKRDGTYDTLFQAWFGCQKNPFPIVTDKGTASDNITELIVSESPLVSSSCVPSIPGIHQVEAGETLFGLAARFYGSGALYECIYDANWEIIGDDPQRLEEGLFLAIPERKICREPVYAYEE